MPLHFVLLNVCFHRWDPGNRYIKAGTIELIFQSSLKLNILRSGHKICRAYGIDPVDYEATIGSLDVGLSDVILGRTDDANPNFMSKNERLWALFADHAATVNNKRALDTFRYRPAHYGTIESLMYKAGCYDQGIFRRWLSYRTWSRWEQLLYLPVIPPAPKMTELAQESILFDRRTLCGLGNEVAQRSVFDLFFLHILNVITFKEAVTSVSSVISYGRYLQVPFRVFDAVIEWISYMLQLLFPLYVLTGLSLVPYCY